MKYLIIASLFIATQSWAFAEADREMCVYVNYGDSREMVIPQDKIFMLSSGKLVPASRLMPGMLLVDPSGNPIPVNTVSPQECP